MSGASEAPEMAMLAHIKNGWNRIQECLRKMEEMKE